MVIGAVIMLVGVLFGSAIVIGIYRDKKHAATDPE
jgi:hypothetical protein